MDECLLDANILVRFLTGEPPELAARASALLHRGERRELALVVEALTVAETVYVLQSVYGWPRREVADALIEVLRSDALTVPDLAAQVQAMTWFRDLRSVHYPEAYLSALAVERGHGRIASFDRAVQRLPGVTVVGP